MRQGLKIRITVFLFILSAVTFGCMPETRKIYGPDKPPEVFTPPLPVENIEKKMAYLRKLLDEEKLNSEDEKLVLDLISAYETVSSYLQDPSTRKDYQKVIQILFTNLDKLEEKYFSRSGVQEAEHSKAMSFFSLKRDAILDHYHAGDYQGVINDAIELEAVFGPDSLTPEIGILFSVSLAKRGMLKEAIIIAEKILPELEHKPDLMVLRGHIIEWQLRLGHEEKAEENYEKLMDHVQENEGILTKSRQLVTGEKRVTPAREQSVGETFSAAGIRFRDSTSLEDVLKQIDELMQRHQFDEAKLLVLRERLKTEEGPDLETLDQALKAIELAEERYQREKIAKLSREKETLKLARQLIEEESYEEALAKLNALENEQGPNAQMNELKEIATEKLINRERNRAAKIFLMAKKTDNPIKKERLLMSSYKILKALVDQYPSSPLNDKLNDHLKKVTEELYKLGKDPES